VEEGCFGWGQCVLFESLLHQKRRGPGEGNEPSTDENAAVDWNRCRGRAGQHADIYFPALPALPPGWGRVTPTVHPSKQAAEEESPVPRSRLSWRRSEDLPSDTAAEYKSVEEGVRIAFMQVSVAWGPHMGQ